MFELLANDPGELNIINVLIAIGIMLVIALVFGFLIMVVSKKFAVAVDEGGTLPVGDHRDLRTVGAGGRPLQVLRRHAETVPARAG